MKKLILAGLLFSTVVFGQVVLSPNMSLPVPIPGVTTGPDWANDINSSLNIIDQHDHSAGNGVRINPSGININADFPMNGNNITSIKTLRFTPQVSPITSAAPNVGALYVAGNELYYNDATGGNQVKITTNGSVNSGAGSITGLPSGTASASYSGGTFIWQSATNTPANMDFGSAIYRNIVANSKGLTLNPPNAMGADYSVTLPPPNSSGGTVFLSYDTSGNMGLGPLLAGGIVGSNIASATITEDKLAPRPSGTAAGNISTSATINTTINPNNTPTDITNATVTLTTTGRPVVLAFMPIQQSTTIGSLLQSSISIGAIGGSGGSGDTRYGLAVLRGTTAIAGANNGQVVSNNSFQVVNPTSQLYVLDNVAAGTYTWKVQIFSGSTNVGLVFANVVLVAYEL
jgi:hypothetical protein